VIGRQGQGRVIVADTVRDSRWWLWMPNIQSVLVKSLVDGMEDIVEAELAR
jgi:hypothetical protein